ncbi:hypothetical protein D3C86_1733910 [compost metagenome]
MDARKSTRNLDLIGRIYSQSRKRSIARYVGQGGEDDGRSIQPRYGSRIIIARSGSRNRDSGRSARVPFGDELPEAL